MKSHYSGLVVMSALNLPIMYAVMFTMVYSLDEEFHNLNTFYMAGMMVAPMVLLKEHITLRFKWPCEVPKQDQKFILE